MAFLKRYLVVSLALVFLVGGTAGWFIRNQRLFLPKAVSTPTVQVHADLSQYQFINPPLFSQSSKDASAPYKALVSSFSDFTASAEQKGDASDISLYFRDLNSGRWTGVNESDVYRPSSMLKVVAMMAVLDIAQNDPTFLSKQLYYKGSDHADQYYKPEDFLSAGYYNTQQLIDAMIIDSDNAALDALLADADIQAHFNSLYSLFRLPVSSTSTPDYMSPASYSVVFRTLYNSSVFSWNLSEQILHLLSETTFDSGLVAGVPSGTLVSHKFGENTALDRSGAVIDRELHDCGIVYYPGHPYLLCVMTKGADFLKLQGVIAGISQIAYGYVSAGSLGQ